MYMPLPSVSVNMVEIKEDDDCRATDINNPFTLVEDLSSPLESLVADKSIDPAAVKQPIAAVVVSLFVPELIPRDAPF